MKIPFLIFLILNCLSSFCQVQADDRYIMWSNDYKLKPSDYRLKYEDYHADTPLTRDYAASKFDIYLDANYEKDTMYYSVYAYFDRDQSMTLTYSEKKMFNEQVEFKLYELFARKLRVRLHQKMTKKYVKNEDYFLNEVKNEMYYFETKHFYIEEPSYEGLNVYLQKCIDSLDEYSAPEGKIILK